jgi:uncharacterized protein YkwD
MRNRTYTLPFLLAFFGTLGQAHAQHVSGVHRESIATTARLELLKQNDFAKVADGTVEQTNAFRESEGLSRLSVDPKLAATAEYFADYMARTDEYGHNADGKPPAERVREHDYDYCLVSENIAYLYSAQPLSADELTRRFVDGWKNSAGHRKNMLDADVIETGVAVARSEKSGYIYAVQMFGRPKDKAYEFKVDNRSGTTVSYTIDDETFELPPNYVRTHQRCRTAPVKFEWDEETEQSARTVHPGTGNTLVIGRGRDGQFTVERRR